MLMDDWTTDAGVIGILIAHLGAFGLGEQKIYKYYIKQAVFEYYAPGKYAIHTYSCIVLLFVKSRSKVIYSTIQVNLTISKSRGMLKIFRVIRSSS